MNIDDLTVGCMWDKHSCSSSDCEVYEACGNPAVETDSATSNDVFCAEHLLLARIAYYERERDRVVAESKSAAKKEKARAFYDRIMTNLKKRDHACYYPESTGWNCPTCGEEFGGASATTPVAEPASPARAARDHVCIRPGGIQVPDLRGASMTLGDMLCNRCQQTADNLGFGPEIEVEKLLEEPLWWLLLARLCDSCGGKVARMLDALGVRPETL
jgi:hypothetical protein